MPRTLEHASCTHGHNPRASHVLGEEKKPVCCFSTASWNKKKPNGKNVCLKASVHT